MIITLPWLKEHLKTKANENEIIEKLTNIGLEVEENSTATGFFKTDSTGDWTLQEGETDIFMLNNRTGKKFKINMTEVD